MKKIFLCLTSIFCFLILTSAATAQTYVVPCYEWQCNTAGDPFGTCHFDAGNCSTGGGVWFWHWDFGDGTSSWWNTGPTKSHYYPAGLTADVTLTLSFFGKAEESTTCEVEYRSVIGPQPDYRGDCDATIPDGCNCQ